MLLASSARTISPFGKGTRSPFGKGMTWAQSSKSSGGKHGLFAGFTKLAPLVAPAPSTKSAIFNHLRCPQRFDLRFFRPLAADLSIRKVSSVFPSLIAAFNHLGVAPRPAQVSPSGLRYFGGTFFPFNALPRRLRAIFPPSNAIEPPSAANCFSSVVRCPDRALSTCVRRFTRDAKSIPARFCFFRFFATGCLRIG